MKLASASGAASVPSNPDELETTRKHAADAVRIGLETGPLTTWPWTELTQRRLPMVCLDARQAQRALDMRANKTDPNDAEGLAHLVRAGWYKEVRVKSRGAMLSKAIAAARRQLLDISTSLSNLVRGLMRRLSALSSPRARPDLRDQRPKASRRGTRLGSRRPTAFGGLAGHPHPRGRARPAPTPQGARRPGLPTAHDGSRHRRRRRCLLCGCHRVA